MGYNENPGENYERYHTFPFTLRVSGEVAA
jgi:hypothetical protein